MTLFVVLLVSLILAPWWLRFARRVLTNPDTIGTPAWLITTCLLFMFAGPLATSLTGFDPYGMHQQTLLQIAFTLVSFWLTAAAFYAGARFLFSGGAQPLALQPQANAVALLREAGARLRPAFVFPVFALISGIQVWLIRTQGVGVSGAAGKGAYVMVDLPYHLVVIFMLVSNAGIPFAAIFGRWATLGNASSVVKAGSIVGIACSAILGIMAGRRELLYTLTMTAFGILWGGRRRAALVFIASGAAAFAVLTIVSPIFLEARAIYSQRNSPGVVEAFSIAIDKWRFSNLATEANTQNVEWRLNTLGSWIGIYETLRPGELNGVILTQAALMTIPRAFTGFSKYRYGAVEDALLANTDISNSVPLESTLDLGFTGPFIYGSIFGLSFALIDIMLAWTARASMLLAVLACGAMIPILISPEANPQTYFSALRAVFIYAVVATPFRFIAAYQASHSVLGRRHRRNHGDRVTSPPRLLPTHQSGSH